MNKKSKKILFVICCVACCGVIGSEIRATISRKGIIKVMDYYEKECDKIEDPVKRDAERHKVNQMISWCIRKVLWGPDSN